MITIQLSVVLNLKDKTAISNFPEEKVTFDQILAMDSNRVTEDSNSLLKRSAASEDMATSEKRLKTSDDVDQVTFVLSGLLCLIRKVLHISG